MNNSTTLSRHVSFILMVLLHSSGALALAESAPPNVVLIFADDLGYGDVGCYGAQKVQTPNIDSLAASGRRFTDAHSSSAVCSPSRYGLLTGEYPLRRNFWGPISPETPLTIDTQKLTLPRLMKEAGYSTACIGKWHLGFGDTEPTDYNAELNPGPLELGFDYYYGIPQVNSGPPFVFVENHSVVGLDPSDPFVYDERSITKPMPEKSGYAKIGGAKAAHRHYVDEQVGTTLKEKAVGWLKQQKPGKPFFMYYATTNIHHPFTPAPHFVGTSDCGRYGDFIHELDWIVGEVTKTLDELGVSDNTLIIFTSDNGGMFNNTAQLAWEAGHRLNGELLGFKFGVWEGGHRVPFIVRWPGRVPADSTSDQLLGHTDLLATLAEIVGRKLDETEGRDSISQLKSFTSSPKKPVRDRLILAPNSPTHLAIRQDRWMYIPAQDSGGFGGTVVGKHLFSGAASLPYTGYTNSDVIDGKIRDNAPRAQLYDLKNDPAQTTNRYAEHPELVQQLDALLKGYREEIPDGTPLGWIAAAEQKKKRMPDKQSSGQHQDAAVKVPRVDGAYVNVYKPRGDVFPGPDAAELVAGTFYEEWIPNDHGFIQDRAGRWHVFGITHPRTGVKKVHAGEYQSFHAVAPEGPLKNALKEGSWTDLPKVLPPKERPGEREQNHAPYIIEREGRYHMVYGPTPIRFAVSDDLLAWTPQGPLDGAPEGRDPNILFWNGIYYLTACSDNEVRTATSTDFVSWRDRGAILTMKEGIAPESPSIIRFNGTFYLFVCGWNGEWDRKTIQGAYQHITYVYQSDDPLKFDHNKEVTTISAHAPEFFQDEEGDWFASSVEWPYRGVSIAPLVWE